MPKELTIPERVTLITRAIDNIEEADAHFREVAAEASSSSVDIDHARGWRDGSVTEFGFQWRNVKAVLAHYEQEEHAKRAVGSTPA